MDELVTNVLGSWGHVIFGMANLSEKQCENKQTRSENFPTSVCHKGPADAIGIHSPGQTTFPIRRRVDCVIHH